MGRYVRLHCDKKTMLTEAIRTERLFLRPSRESDCDDLFEFLSQLADDEFEGYPGISWKTAGNVPSWKLLEKLGLRREAHLRQNIWFHRDENDNPIWKDTLVYAILEDEASW